MTKEDRDLLIRDLAGRIPYGVIGTVPLTVVDTKHYDMDGYHWDDEVDVDVELDALNIDGIISVSAIEPNLSEEVMYAQEAEEWSVEEFKPYLRRIVDLTDEEIEEIDAIGEWEVDRLEGNSIWGGDTVESASDLIHFFNVHHIDYNHLIEKGLAYADDKRDSVYKIAR